MPETTFDSILVVFNPSSGVPGNEGEQLLYLLKELQNLNFLANVFFIQPNCDLRGAIQSSLDQGVHYFVACGGDGTIDSVASILANPSTKLIKDSPLPILAIIPTGTQNNIALSLGIPTEIQEAASLLRKGKILQIDMGVINCGGVERIFMEACSIGLLSALFPAADDIQHGNLPRVGEFLGTLIAFPLSEIHIKVDDQPETTNRGHVVLISNLTYIGPHVAIPSASAVDDGLLDVLVFNDLTKLDILSYAALASGTLPDQANIQHYHMRKIEVTTEPAMPVLADGFELGETPLSVEVLPKSLSIFVKS